MSIRLPLKTVLDFTDTDNVGAGSALGGVAKAFKIPQDCDNVVVKLHPSVTGGTVSATLQTSDDGGTTYYDVLRTQTQALSTGAGYDLWASAPVEGMGMRSFATGSASTTTGTTQASIMAVTGNCAASTLVAGEQSGLPILGIQNRIFLIYTGDQTVNNTRVKVLVNSQSATA